MMAGVVLRRTLGISTGGQVDDAVEDLRPSLFVAMPYGTKHDPTGRTRIDFDRIYREAIVPAAQDARVDAVRADEDRGGGLVHLTMFERLLLAEVVIADVTLASPNVMYELGIRHATRPRATILTFAHVGQLPFDISPMRAIPYHLSPTGAPTTSGLRQLRQELTTRLQAALEDRLSPDSPLFQLIADYPGVSLPHDATEAFQRRTRALITLSREIRDAGGSADKPAAVVKLRELELHLGGPIGAPTEVLLDLLLSYRDLEAYDDMVRLCSSLPPGLSEHPTVQQQFAFALNRRKDIGDDDRAERVLLDLIDAHGASPETYGLLGRVYKDRYTSLSGERAEAALDDAIQAYRSGFEADPRDYYPGLNAVTLLLLKATAESWRIAREELSPVVAFAIARRGGAQSRDYWDVAAALELAVINQDRAVSSRAAARLLNLGPTSWQLKTTANNLHLLVTAFENHLGAAPEWLPALTAFLEYRTT